MENHAIIVIRIGSVQTERGESMKEYIIKIGDEPDIMGNYALKEKPKELVRCKDCKHRPTVVEEKDSVGVMETYYEFPDDSKCPCQNTNDAYYSWCPDDDWFCADGERQDSSC